ncbi:MAG: SMC family ATPase [Clostridiales bacterium]|jgi:exonuclease SbcC|nr:SMC family ATPase [Clostridiales bacterium]
MKPVKLTVSAFICYADEQVIDFTKLGENGLYLITGQTGAGKTAIFDAVSYALYGEASGEARDKPEKLRSQYADVKDKTAVDFDFVSNGNKYNIRRELKPQINRDTKEITKLNEAVVLTLADGTVLDRDKEVKAKIEQIVGLDKDQFAQIVMIAQNDFLRFLQSGTDKRVDILRRIFSTGHIKWFQERLKAERKKAEDALQLVKRDFESRGVDPYKRDEVFADWKKQIADGESFRQELDKQIESQGAAEKELAAAVAVAEGIAKLFADLEKSRRDEMRHAGRKAEIDGLRANKIRGEIALYKVKPTADKCYAAKDENKKAVEQLSIAKADADTAEKSLKEAAETLTELPSVETLEAAHGALEKKRAAAGDKFEKLASLKKEYSEIAEREEELAAARSVVEVLREKFTLADGKYKDLYDRFIRGQAGLLAKELKAGEACPVCGSTAHPVPAALFDGSVNEKELGGFQKAAENAKSELDKKASACTALISQIATLKGTFVKNAKMVIKDMDADTAADKLKRELEITGQDYKSLTTATEESKAALDKLKADFAAATKRKNESDTALATAAALVRERTKRAAETAAELNGAVAAFRTALEQGGFADENAYADALLSEDRLAEITKIINGYDEDGKQIKRDIARLEGETKGKQNPDADKLRRDGAALAERAKKLKGERDTIITTINGLSGDLKTLTKAAKDFVAAEKKLAAVKGVSDAANGKLDFETYAQTAYFERVLRAANLRLRAMSQNRYALVRKAEAGDRRQKTGLEIDVLDAHTGKPRSVDSLSGGESFMASLSLALGLSDVVQQRAGSIHLDAMFIDEGFGSLDADVLDLSIKTLSDMAGNNRVIGIISHVAELRERIDKRIDVEKTPAGSKIFVSA